MKNLVHAVILLLFAFLVPVAHAAPRPCEGLSKLALPHTTVTSAQLMSPGAFEPPAAVTPWLLGDLSLYKRLPAFCRVTAVSKPSSDSDIKIEIWLPAANWNGRFRGQGNGGFAGEIDYGSLAQSVAHGYAAAGSDTGHAASGIDASWALNHPEKIVDFAYRAIHEMTVIGKAATKAFYGDAAHHSYFSSCSNGGRQALMEAQRYPDDYDGIIAGAPANYWTHLLGGSLWDVKMTTRDAAAYIPAAKIPAIARAVDAACDAKDGVTDGVLNDPRTCHFRPETMLCKSGDSDSCLTHEQVTTLEELYQGARDASGRQIFPGYLPGGEDGPGGWGIWITGPSENKSLIYSFSVGFFANMLYNKPEWDYKSADVDQAVAEADAKYAAVLNATQSNLKPFMSHGGKLILYHGWNDAAISPLNTINYFHSVVRATGEKNAGSFLRLYMVPGMQHCGGGPGTDNFGATGLSEKNDPQHNMYLALEDWVEKGEAPGTIIAAKMKPRATPPVVDRTRPLCVYPQEAKYKGSGDTNDAASFVCALPAVKQ